jgi:hypothetical protein
MSLPGCSLSRKNFAIKKRSLYKGEPFGMVLDPNRLRTGCYHHRFMPVAFSLGSVSPTQIGCQASHAARSSRQYSHRGDCHGRTDPPGQHPRSVDLGGRSHLPDVPWGGGLRATCTLRCPRLAVSPPSLTVLSPQVLSD